MTRGHRSLVGAVLYAAAALRTAPLAAQEPGRVYRLVQMGPKTVFDRLAREHILPELARNGFVEGRNLLFDVQAGPFDRLGDLARDTLTDRPDAIMTIGSVATRAMFDATRTVPILMFADNPVGGGLAASLARPGGNVTGVANMVIELQVKRFEILLDAMPQVHRVGVLVRGSSLNREATERSLAEVAAATGRSLVVVHAEGADDYAAAFAELRANRAEALIIGSDPGFSEDMPLLVRHAEDAVLPTICEWASNARAGCVLGYGADRKALLRRMASQIVRVFRGTDPGEIPIEQPTAFEFVVNLGAAQRMGATIAFPVLARADEVID